MGQRSFCGIFVAIVMCNTTAFTFGQLSVDSTGGSIAANLEFAGTITNDLVAVHGPFETVSGYNFSAIQGSAGPGSITFNYDKMGPYDFTTATGFGTGGFRMHLDYTNNSGEALESLQFGLSGSDASFLGLNGIPARGIAMNPAGPNPKFTGVASGQVPNGDGITYSATNIGWNFATPLGNGDIYSFFLPIVVPVTQSGGTPSGDPFTLAITPTAAVSESGDFNGDHVVDAADYVVWRKGLGTIYTPTDYDAWRSHFGQTAGSGSGATMNSAVPEPASLVMLIIGMLAICVLRRGPVVP
jgi:PEP-CTERM motif